jgi:hypothetical protein
MSCQEFWDTMPELGAPGAPPDAEHREHLEECAACAALLGRQRVLETGLRAVAGVWSRVEAPARVEARLKAAFRGQAGLAVRRPASRWWVPVVTWASAAAAVIALAMFLVRGREPSTEGAPPQRVARGSVELAALEWPAGDEADGDFIPLPNAAQVGPNEDVDLVRLEVPRSAMIALGFAVSADRASERVQAEVMLGADGLARAVRFLN